MCVQTYSDIFWVVGVPGIQVHPVRRMPETRVHPGGDQSRNNVARTRVPGVPGPGIPKSRMCSGAGCVYWGVGYARVLGVPQTRLLPSPGHMSRLRTEAYPGRRCVQVVTESGHGCAGFPGVPKSHSVARCIWGQGVYTFRARPEFGFARAGCWQVRCNVCRRCQIQDTVTIFTRDDGTPVARQSVLRPGRPDQCYSLYCYLHQCAIVKRPVDWPDVASIHRWLCDGDLHPKGVAGKPAHKRTFPRGARGR
jgi:hypothetical protein